MSGKNSYVGDTGQEASFESPVSLRFRDSVNFHVFLKQDAERLAACLLLDDILGFRGVL